MRSDVHRKSLQDLTMKPGKEKSTNNKGPQCLEIAIPVIQGMQDDTVEPLQKFFEEQHFDAWHFDVFELHRITKNHSLWFIGMILFEHYKIIDIFQINNAKLSTFLLTLEEVSWCVCCVVGFPKKYLTPITTDLLPRQDNPQPLPQLNSRRRRPPNNRSLLNNRCNPKTTSSHSRIRSIRSSNGS